MTREEIAQIIKKARMGAGLTQLEAATAIGRKQQTLASWETGQSQPDANTLFQLFDFYGVSVDEAFGLKAADHFVCSSDEQMIIEAYRQASPDDKAIVDNIVKRYTPAASSRDARIG